MPDRTPPDWWPHPERSRFETLGALRWHVQHWPCRASGDRPPRALLLHGTGSGSFSWRHLAPRLAEHFEVFAPDLPGHAFTLTPDNHPLSLPAVSRTLSDWLRHASIMPDLLVGHSAGAAIALRLALDGAVSPRLIASINGALLPMRGPIGRLFQPIAKLLSTSPLAAPAFAAWASGPGAARRLLDSTGSRIDPEGERCYALLVADRLHAAGALRLMASWDLSSLEVELPGLAAPLLLVATLGDRTLPPIHARRAHALLPSAARVELPSLGHLAHEENAQAILEPLLHAWAASEKAPTCAD